MWQATLLKRICALANDVGQHILTYSNMANDALSVRYKENDTPLTLADESANERVVAGLTYLTPDWPIISEEEVIPPFSERSQWETYWLIDPLDGTRGFLEQRAEFTVNIALIHHNQPVMGVVYAPVEGLCYYAAQGSGAFCLTDQGERRRLSAEPRSQEDPLRLVLGRYSSSPAWQEKLSKHFPNAEFIRLNSSLKLCWLADGLADLYPRAGNICEWDVAAAHCVLNESGGLLADSSGQSLQYNQSEGMLCSPFGALADANDWEPLKLEALLAK